MIIDVNFLIGKLEKVEGFADTGETLSNIAKSHIIEPEEPVPSTDAADKEEKTENKQSDEKVESPGSASPSGPDEKLSNGEAAKENEKGDGDGEEKAKEDGEEKTEGKAKS